MPPFENGQILAGKYRVERVLGVGGMGMVLLAHHLDLDELVAVKVVLPDLAGEASILERFSREARAAIRIKSEHVARVMDVGRLEDGLPFMVMEYLEGSDLGVQVESHAPMRISDAVDYIVQTCEAVAYAHARGVVHRDLKPSNLFLTHRLDGTPCIKVLDFGISKIAGRGTGASGGVTKTSAVMGSPMYMSPEQLVASKDVDFRTDVWSLGVILYELITGIHPFDAELLPQICTRVMQVEPRAMREIRPETPAALQDAVSRCLEKVRERRWSSIAEFAAAIAPFGSPSCASLVESMQRARMLTTDAPPPVPVKVPSVAPAAKTALTSSADVVAKPSRSMIPIIAGVGVLVVGAASVWIWIAMSKPAPAPTAGIVGGVDFVAPSSSAAPATTFSASAVSSGEVSTPDAAYDTMGAPSGSAPKSASSPPRPQGSAPPAASGKKPPRPGSKRGLDMFNDTE